MKMNNENKFCRNECEKCVYYFEETDFCLNHMYSVRKDGVNCPDKKSKMDYPSDTLIVTTDLEFSYELTDCRDDDLTIGELFEELRTLYEE